MSTSKRSFPIAVAVLLFLFAARAYALPPRIAWDPYPLEGSVTPGEEATYSVSITNTGYFRIPRTKKLQIGVRGDIGPYVTVEQPVFPRVFRRGDQVTFDVTFLLPQGSTGVFEGELVLQRMWRGKLLEVWRADALPVHMEVEGANHPPVADAGPDQTIAIPYIGQTGTLDGSASSDADGDPLTFEWSLTARPEGSTATLSDPTAVNPTFTIDVPGTYTAQLIVHDGTDSSAADTVTISTENSAPVADAGPDQTVLMGETVTLDGSSSSDVDGDLLSYAWSLPGAPAGSTATLSAPTEVMPTFVVDLPGSYVAQLIVNDGTLDSAPDTVTIDTRNSAPVADAGADQTALVGDTVTLDGSRSSDVDGDPLSFFWSLSTPSGSAAALNDASIVAPSFDVDLPGSYLGQLIVNDGVSDSAPDIVAISTVNSAPVADAGLDHTVYVGNTVLLDGRGSIDADGDPLTYSWSFTSVPAGSSAAISDPTAEVTDFMVDIEGIYLVQLIVHDGHLDSNPSRIVVNAHTGFSKHQVGPLGGRFESPIGIILDIPEGAVDEEIEITIADLPCEEVDPILSGSIYATPKKRCVGGFIAEPDGLVFNLPITATVPIQQLEPGEIPILIKIDPIAQSYSSPQTDMIYDGDQNTTEVKITSFSYDVVAAIRRNETDKKCKTCEGYLEHRPFCDYDPIQSGCCYIPDEVLSGCGFTCDCCKEKRAVIRSEEIDFTSGDCQILGSKVSVGYPECKEKPTDPTPVEDFTLSEISRDCPSDLTYQINVDPPTLTLPVCQEKQLNATIEGRSADGNIILEPTTIYPFWESSAPEIAAFTQPQPDGTIKALTERSSPVEIAASAGDIPNILPGTMSLSTVCHVCDLFLSVTEGQVKIGAFLPVSVDAINHEGAFFSVAEAGHGEVTWSSSNSQIAYVIPSEGGMTFVVGNQPGIATITAEYKSACEEISASSTIEVLMPDELIIQAKFGDCGWNAPYCEFPSPNNNVTLSVRTGIPDNGVVAWQSGIQVNVEGYVPGTDNTLDVIPLSGVTDEHGEFTTDLTPIPTIPYIAARISAVEDASAAIEEIDIRAISLDFCHENVHPQCGSPYGSESSVRYDPRDAFSYINASRRHFSGFANVRGRSSGPLYITLPDGRYKDVTYIYEEQVQEQIMFWDTLLIVPTDLSLLGKPVDTVEGRLIGEGFSSGFASGDSVGAFAGVSYGFSFLYPNSRCSFSIANLAGSSFWCGRDYSGYYTVYEDSVDISETFYLQAQSHNIIGMPWQIGYGGGTSGATDHRISHEASSGASANLDVSWGGIKDILLEETGSSIGPFKGVSCSGEHY